MTLSSRAGGTLWGRIQLIIADREMPVIRHALVVGLMTAIPIGLIAAVSGILGHTQFTVERLIHSWPIPGHPLAGFVIGLLDTVLFSPFVESGLALVPIWVLRRLRVAEATIPVIACLFWAVLHTRSGNWLQLIQAWPFYCFTLVLIKHEKPSLDRAWLRSSLVHAMHNSLGMLWGLPVALMRS